MKLPLKKFFFASWIHEKAKYSRTDSDFSESQKYKKRRQIDSVSQPTTGYQIGRWDSGGSGHHNDADSETLLYPVIKNAVLSLSPDFINTVGAAAVYGDSSAAAA